MNPKISLVIPTFEANGRAVEFLTKLFDSIKDQTFKDYEILVPDHSQDDVIKDFCESYEMDIDHFFNERGRGNSSINMNEGIKKSKGKYIKVLHMDDFLNNKEALQLLWDGMESNPEKKWVALTFDHLYENENNTTRHKITPQDGITFGCPSITGFVNGEEIYFDENIFFLNDKDLNDKLEMKYGLPYVVNELCVTIRIYSGQVSKTHSHIESKEREYLSNKDYSKWKTN